MSAAGNSRAVEPLAVEGRRVRLRDWRADDLPVYERWIICLLYTSPSPRDS